MEQNNFPITKQVKSYIERKPYILEAIEQNKDFNKLKDYKKVKLLIGY